MERQSGGGTWGWEEQGQAEPWPCSSPSPLTTSTTPSQPRALTMPVSDVKMTISYKGASCWNKVSMPGRFLNLQPVASWKCSERRDTLRPRAFSPVSVACGGIHGHRAATEALGSGPPVTADSSLALTVCPGTPAITTGGEAAQGRKARPGGVTPPPQDRRAGWGLHPSLVPASMLLTVTTSSHPGLCGVPNPLLSPRHTDHSGCKRTPVSSKTSVYGGW